MKTNSPKDGYYTLYLLPAEWYVGMTGGLEERLYHHKHSKPYRDISHWIILAEVDTKQEALGIEKHYHNMGYNGKWERNYEKIDWISSRAKAVLNTDYVAKVANTNYASFQKRRVANTDYVAKVANTDYVAKVANTDYASFQKRRVANTNWELASKRRVANTDYAVAGEKKKKPILQFTISGILIQEWPSAKDASASLGIHSNDIGTCCRGKQKTAGGFIWEFKNTK